MKRFLLIPLFSLACALFAIDWPSPTGTITKNFGWNDEGRPHMGVSFSDDKEFFAAEDGELIFRYRERDTASKLPSPFGSWIAVDHNDGIISIYSRFDDNSSPELPNVVKKGELLGKSGISGWTGQSGVYLQLFDRKEKRWLNPSMIFPPLPDKRPPIILSIRLRDNQGKLFDPAQTRNLGQGRYNILVDSFDTMLLQNEAPLAPYRILCSLNGSEVGALNFETYSSRDGSLMLYRNGLLPVKQIYAPYPLYEAAEVWLSRGQSTLEIIAQDIAGNDRRVVYRLMVE